MAERRSNNKVANGLVALSSAAVLAVYTAGYLRTRPATARFEVQTAERRPAVQPVLWEVRPETPAPEPVSASAPAPVRSVPKHPQATVAPKPVELSEPPPTTTEVSTEVATVAAAPLPIAVPALPVAPTLPPPAPKWKDGT